MNQPYLFIPILLIPLFLSGCAPKAVSGSVVDKMMDSISQVKQLEATGQLKLAGTTDTAIFNGLKELTANFDARVDIANLDNLKFSLLLDLSGQAPEGSTQISAEIRGLPDYTYFRVKDAKIPAGLSLSLVPDARWYKVKNPENSEGNVLGGGVRLTNDDGAKIRELIKNSKLFVVQTTLADETIKGTRCYHLAALIDQTELSKLLDAIQAGTGDRVKLDRAAVLKLATNYTYDLWVSKRDYYLTKLVAHGNLAPAGQSESVFEVLLSHFNSSVNVVAPSEVKEFTIDSLLKSPLGQL